MAALAFKPPAGACDTHAHVIGDGVSHAFIPDRTYTPPPATEEDYSGMLAACGMSRGVLVQVSVHGVDNRFMLQTLAHHPDFLRGIAVVDSDISDVELMQLHDSGVRGIRFHILFGGGPSRREIQQLCERIAVMGWHAEFLFDIRHLSELFSDAIDIASAMCIRSHGTRAGITRNGQCGVPSFYICTARSSLVDKNIRGVPIKRAS